MSQYQNNKSEQISNNLIDWVKIYGRDFPWRKSDNLYHILIAEWMLHRTETSQMTLIFNNFVERYPNIQTLSAADYKEIITTMSQLGLNCRTKLKIEIIDEINDVYSGRSPESKQGLISLHEIADLVPSAIRCIAFCYPDIVADNNTSIVISRLFGFEDKMETRRMREVREAYWLILNRHIPREFNYELHDLTATICIIENKRYSICAIFDFCKTVGNGVI